MATEQDKNLDGWRKNLSRITEGWNKMLMEWAEATEKVKDAVKRKDWKDAIHHLSDYRGAGTQHLWRLHFYLFWPKWITIVITTYLLAR